MKAQERAELEKQLDKQADDLVSRSLAGESVALGVIQHESNRNLLSEIIAIAEHSFCLP